MCYNNWNVLFTMQLHVAWGGEAEEENPVEMSHVEDAFSEFMRLICQHKK
jgi:hypothetical protein